MLSHALTAAALLSYTWAAPAPARIEPRQASSSSAVSGVVDAPTATPYPPKGSTGTLRGSEDLLGYSPSNPLSDKDTQIPADEYQLAPGQSENADLGLYLDLSHVENPQPIRGYKDGPTDPGPRNKPIDRENSDLFIPPGTDAGGVPNAKWPLGLSHNRHGIGSAGWARQQNTDELPIATAMAGVDMRLSPNAYRELHWHKANEWSLILTGTVRIASVDESGRTFVDDLQAGDVWFFPAGKPHSIQAFETGVEFLLVFDDGSFSEDNTFLVSELMERNPLSVLAKDLMVDTSAFKNIPDGELYIFDGTPAPKNINEQNVTGPAGVIPRSGTYSYHFSEQQPLEVPGGSVKILDPVTFPTAANFAAALFTVKPGAMRELHWHTSSDEWNYIISGSGRLTVYVAPDSSQTFDFQAGDVGYVPVPNAHYLENTGTEDLVYLGMFLSCFSLCYSSC